MPCTAPAGPPGTQARVPVSPPGSVTSRGTSAKELLVRNVHTAEPSVGRTAPLPSVAWSGVPAGAGTTARRSRCSGATSSSVVGQRVAAVQGDRISSARTAQLSPADGSPSVTVEHLGGELTEDADELGRQLVPAGRVRVRCAPSVGPVIVTPWLDACGGPARLRRAHRQLPLTFTT